MIWLEFIHVINVHLAAFECHSNFSDVIIAQILSVTASTLETHVSVSRTFSVRLVSTRMMKVAIFVFYPDDLHQSWKSIIDFFAPGSKYFLRNLVSTIRW
jgi:hypothetical protein